MNRFGRKADYVAEETPALATLTWIMGPMLSRQPTGKRQENTGWKGGWNGDEVTTIDPGFGTTAGWR